MPDWKLFFLHREGVERFLFEANQHDLLEYHAAGTVTRLTFPAAPWRSMRMSSLKDRIELLETDLKAVPPRISVYHDLPFAILRYDPAEEWELRREIKLLGTRLEDVGKEVHIIPMSEFLWKAIDETEGMDVVVGLEREDGYRRAQDQVTTYLSDQDWRPLADMLAERLATLDPQEGNRLPDEGGGDVAGPLPHVQAARRDAGQDACDHDPVLPRLDRRHDRPAVHGPEGPGCPGQLPGQDLRLRHR